MEKCPFQRYDPKKHPDYSDYIQNNPNPGRDLFDKYKDLRIHFALNGDFTPLIQTFAEKAATVNKDKLVFPVPHGERPTYGSTGFGTHYLHSISTRNLSDFEFAFVSRPDDLFGVELAFPIGEYGKKISLAGIEAGRVVNSLVNTLIERECVDVNKKYFSLIQAETFMRHSQRTIVEGVQSIIASYSLLIAEKVPGFEDPIEVFNQLVENKVFNEHASLSPIGQIVPMARAGKRYPYTLVNKAGKVVMDERLKELLKNEKLLSGSQIGPGFRNQGCPEARENTPIEDGVIKESGINILARVYGQYLEHYYRVLSCNSK